VKRRNKRGEAGGGGGKKKNGKKCYQGRHSSTKRFLKTGNKVGGQTSQGGGRQGSLWEKNHVLGKVTNGQRGVRKRMNRKRGGAKKNEAVLVLKVGVKTGRAPTWKKGWGWKCGGTDAGTQSKKGGQRRDA